MFYFRIIIPERMPYCQVSFFGFCHGAVDTGPEMEYHLSVVCHRSEHISNSHSKLPS
jgi:hypothetical protein